MIRIVPNHVLKNIFNQKVLTIQDPKLLVTAVQLPNGAIEVITNTQELPAKIAYIQTAYDGEFRLQQNPNVQIVEFILL